MLYLLDTNAVSGEVLFGISRLAKRKKRMQLEQAARIVFALIPCKPIPVSAGDHYAAIKLARRLSGKVIDENDLWIAATALALGAASWPSRNTL